MEMEMLKPIVIVAVLSASVLFLFHRLRAPTIIGFLITGVLAGPQGLRLIHASEQVDLIAELGVILLLFTVGIEISLKDILRIKKYVLVGGSLQVLLTALAVSLIALYREMPPGEAVLIGFLVSLSSTAIVLRIIQKQEEFSSLYGKTTLGILIFQDLAVVPMMLVIPLLPGSSLTESDSPLIIAIKAVSLIALIIISSKWVVPRALYYVARTQDREIFLLTIVSICLSIAWITSYAGLSLGLGAFLAGLIISESPYSHQAFGNIVPLRDAFTSFFFISIGMLLDVNLLVQNPAYIIMLTVSVIALKALLSGFAISLLGLPLRIIVLVAMALSQIGEFSFVLSKTGFESGLLPLKTYNIFLDVTVITMAATSLVMAVSPKVADSISVHQVPLFSRLKARPYPSVSPEFSSLKDHLLIIGYGVNGRNVARSARGESIPYLIVEIDPEIVSIEGKRGEPIYFGDATQEAVLEHVGIKKARVMVIAISDPRASRRITELARRLNPDLFIIVRTRYIMEMKPLHDLGADEVIPEEYETSIEIFSRVLDRYGVPRNNIESFIRQVREDGYDMLRSFSKEPICHADLSITSEDIVTLKVCGGSPAEGRRLADLELEGFGIKPLAVHRGMETLRDLTGDFVLFAEDVIVLVGKEDKIHKVDDLFKGTDQRCS